MDTNVIKDLIGVIVTEVETATESDDNDAITFTLSDGRKYQFHHEQDCCESVFVEDINGDWADIIGTPIIVAEEREDSGERAEYESYTYTFYTFRTVKGSVDVRWNGQSNGYYSESVDHGFINP